MAKLSAPQERLLEAMQVPGTILYIRRAPNRGAFLSRSGDGSAKSVKLNTAYAFITRFVLIVDNSDWRVTKYRFPG